MFVIYVGFFIEPPRDFSRMRYLSCTMQLDALAQAAERYKVDFGEYPKASEGLKALVLDPGATGWHGPYLEKDVPLDPWGRPYLYLRSSNSATPEILSYGADGKPGGVLFDTDISTRTLRRPIPDSPYEVRALGLVAGIWIAAWCYLIGSILVLVRNSRERPVP